MSLLLSILLGVAGIAGAAEHTVEVSVWKGADTFTHRAKIEEGRQDSFVGPVSSKRGTQRQMVFNTLYPAGSRGHLQYQLEVSQPGPDGTTFQVQGEVGLAGAPLRTVECDGWTLTLKEVGAGRTASPGNYRIGADLQRSEAKVACRQVLAEGTQGNVVSGGTRGGKKFGVIFNALLAPGKGGFDLQYQLEFSPPGATSLQIQKEATLALGKTRTEKSGSYVLQLRIDKP